MTTGHLLGVWESKVPHAAHRLAPLQRLRFFSLAGDDDDITARSLASLPTLPSLEVLYLRCHVRADEGLLAVFQKLPRLAELHLSVKDRAPNAEYSIPNFGWEELLTIHLWCWLLGRHLVSDIRKPDVRQDSAEEHECGAVVEVITHLSATSSSRVITIGAFDVILLRKALVIVAVKGLSSRALLDCSRSDQSPGCAGSHLH